jgi:subtilisin family serine protease
LQTIIGGLSSPISCGATDDLDQLASYSGRGPAAWETMPYTDYPYQNGTKMGLLKPDVCAPGPGTTSCNFEYTGTTGQPYMGFGGTSAATPHVGGCLVLLAHACVTAGKPINPAYVQEALENTAVRVSGQTRDKENHFGAGRVDVYAAYKYGQARGWW